MPFVGRGEIGQGVGENDFELLRSQRCPGRKGPGGKVGIVRGKVKPVQRNRIGAGIVEFEPGNPLAEAVGEAGQILGLQLVDPERRKGGQRPADGVRSARSAEGGGHDRCGRSDCAAGNAGILEAHRKRRGRGVGALEVPEA